MPGLRESILGYDGRVLERLELPAATVYVRTMTVAERDEWEVRCQEEKAHYRSRLIGYCCCDEDGRNIFTNQDLAAIEALPSVIVEPIVDAALRINKASKEEADKIRKN
jgi:hypothetical protein